MNAVVPIRRLYQPSSGTEGDGFFASWCCQCARDKSMREGEPLDECDDNEVCPIIAKTFAYNVTDPEYPVEWCYDEKGRPQCTAFVASGPPLPTQRELEEAGQARLFA